MLKYKFVDLKKGIGDIMSEVKSSCFDGCNNNCGCGCGNNGFGFEWLIIIIIILCFCGGFGNNFFGGCCNN